MITDRYYSVNKKITSGYHLSKMSENEMPFHLQWNSARNVLPSDPTYQSKRSTCRTT